MVEELRSCDHLLCGSRLIRDSFVSRGYPAACTTVIPYCIDTSRFHPLSAKEKSTLRDDRFRVICVAQIVPRR